MSILHEDVEPEQSEPDEGPITKPDEEECDEEDNLEDNPPTPDDEVEVHSSGYNLRKRELINYGEARKYKLRPHCYTSMGRYQK